MWLHPCAGLYRTQRVGREFFEGMPAYLEWTFMAMRLALSREIRFVNEPTFVYNADTAGSLSKSKNYIVQQPHAIKRLMELEPPPHLVRLLKEKYAAALHDASAVELFDGNRAAAWRLHLKSLWHGGLMRYGLYTRHLFFRRQ
jgi:hypothetical protein